MPRWQCKNSFIIQYFVNMKNGQDPRCEGFNLQVPPTTITGVVMKPRVRFAALTTLVEKLTEGSRSDSLRICPISKKTKQEVAIYQNHDGQDTVSRYGCGKIEFYQYPRQAESDH